MKIIDRVDRKIDIYSYIEWAFRNNQTPYPNNVDGTWYIQSEAAYLQSQEETKIYHIYLWYWFTMKKELIIAEYW